MADCINKIREVRSMPENRGMKVLVTSDSHRFLSAVSGRAGILTIQDRTYRPQRELTANRR